MTSPLDAGQPEDRPELDRGRALFDGDRDIAASIDVTFGARKTTAALFPCASCHGRDGLGRREADAAAPAIIRGAHGIDRPGRGASDGVRPAYDRDAFALAITGGVASDGRQLGARMPRYAATAEDVDALWSWLGALPGTQRQGVKAGKLTFALVGSTDDRQRAGSIAAELLPLLESLPPRYGFRLTLRTELYLPGDERCPGKDALAIIVAGLDPERALLRAAKRCGVPVIVPFHDLVGSEDRLDVRGMTAPLQLQWRSLRKAAGPEARVVLPGRLAAWEKTALRQSGILGPDVTTRALQQSQSSRQTLFLPFGLDRSEMPDAPASVLAPLSGSLLTYSNWLKAGHRLRLSVAEKGPEDTDGGGRPSQDRLLVELLDKATLLSGTQPTRAGFMEAIDAVLLGPAADPWLDYRTYGLAGTGRVIVLASDP